MIVLLKIQPKILKKLNYKILCLMINKNLHLLKSKQNVFYYKVFYNSIVVTKASSKAFH